MFSANIHRFSGESVQRARNAFKLLNVYINTFLGRALGSETLESAEKRYSLSRLDAATRLNNRRCKLSLNTYSSFLSTHEELRNASDGMYVRTLSYACNFGHLD
ncbi:uncharacterized protein LOC143154906 [Ptiloglossa arizonensis]|uniref:uncharacterized protein LOC143154906 n=1 Tax=Ptiloglossa arizonensis TaxID=3350558 RepID=UPI003FA1080C